MPITLTSRYKPLTYDEITKPLIEQTAAQEELENAYMEAQNQAAQLQAQANAETDPIAYARLRSYANNLQQQAESLMQQGLNRNSRTALLNTRRRYNQEIVPVQAAITRRNELMDERRKLRLTHPDMLQEREVLSIDDLLQNPSMDLGTTLYGSDIAKRAAAITSAIGRGRQSIALGQNLDKYTQQILSQSGLTPEEIQSALNGDDTVLDRALSNLYASTGVDSWNNQAAKDAVRGYIQEGAMQGVGESKISLQRDAVAEQAAKNADRDRSEIFQAALYGMYKDSEGNWAYDPTRPGPKVKGRLKADGSGDGVTDEDFEFVPKDITGSNDYYRKKDDGTWWHKNGKNYYPVTEAQTVETLNNNYVSPVRLADSRTNLKDAPLYFAGKNFEVIRENNSEFSEDDATPVDVASLSSQAQKKLLDTLKEYYPGIKVTDVKIYKDYDLIGRDEYKIVLKDKN